MHPAWAQLVKVAEVQITQRKNAILAPAKDADAGLAAEYMKGELQGIQLFVRIPQLVIDNTDDEGKPVEGAM